MREFERIGALKALFEAAGPPGGWSVGIGDDAAVLAPPGEPLVVSIDAAFEGTHFRRDLLSLGDIGYRATMAAASDLAAMGAEPVGLLSALGLPAAFEDEELSALARGQAEAARELGAPVVGGNLARAEGLSITTTVIGRTPRPIGRGGTRPGDAIFVAGALGLAGAGLRALLEKKAGAALGPALEAFCRPRARIEAGIEARPFANACIDLSDGLAQDLAHVARASGVTAVLDPQALVSPELEAAAAALGLDPLALALGGGEDYALAVFAPPSARLLGFRRIGGCEPDRGFSVALARGGGLEAVDPKGFDHFAR